MPSARRRPALVVVSIVVAVAIAAAVAIGIAQSSGSGNGEEPLTLAQIRAGIAAAAPAAAAVPKPLAALQAEGGQLLDGGQRALDARLATLRGHPIVVNVWGSWCGPCRAEFPLFQRASVAAAKRVAFLGVATQDGRASAARFLRREPVPYPSYLDPDRAIAHHYGLVGTPSTIFYDGRGHTAIKTGVYTSLADLEHDIGRYARRA